MNIIGLVVLVVTAIGVATEGLTLTRNKDQLGIPKGDWLSVLLGVLPSFGVLTINIECWMRPFFEPNWVLTGAGLALCAGCIVFRGWGKAALGGYYTFSIDIRDDHEVVDYGPYRIVRHPLYFGALLGIIGLPILAHSWLGVFTLTIPTGTVYGIRLFLEDRFLYESLGEPYQAYASRTSRLIPFIW
ncbi:MAG: isoprenylcysteine carboxylmethyltransferase family protein [Elusimicrobia bacterium]|nr:isoprenylcysteine carboxylmethyltransferase family protein [Elusimicrobiota bacterium]